jgi:hypothetical protein
MRYRKFTQVAYIPTHAKGDINHKDVQFGFITSEIDSEHCYFVRYWRSRTDPELRTKADGERTPVYLLTRCVTRSRQKILDMAKELGLC